jgi:hypothetical protein
MSSYKVSLLMIEAASEISSLFWETGFCFGSAFSVEICKEMALNLK